jgi:hypothetical protein
VRIPLSLLHLLILRAPVAMPGYRSRAIAQSEITCKGERRCDVGWRLAVEPDGHASANVSRILGRWPDLAKSATYRCSVATATISMGSLSTLSFVRWTGDPFFV